MHASVHQSRLTDIHNDIVPLLGLEQQHDELQVTSSVLSYDYWNECVKVEFQQSADVQSPAVIFFDAQHTTPPDHRAHDR